MSEKIAQSLSAQFNTHRIVFWYDSERDMRDAYEALDLTDVIKLEIANNEFGIKHRVLKREPDHKFLLYKHGPKPVDDLENWLLDVELAHTEFRTDRVQGWLAELGLGVQQGDLLKQHEEFFRSTKRLSALKALLGSNHSSRAIRLAMLAVIFDTGAQVEQVTEEMLAGVADGSVGETWKLVERCDLEGAFWALLAEEYGYTPADPSPEDFALNLFKSCYALELDETASLNKQVLVTFTRWKSNRHHESAFETLSERFAEALTIERDIRDRDYRSLAKLDMYKATERHVIRALISDIAHKTISRREVADIVRKRKRMHWANKDEFRHIYGAIESAADFLDAISRLHLGVESLSDGVRQYTETGFRIDQLYRKYIYHQRKSGQTSLLEALTDEIENTYSNQFLLPLNDLWQAKVDRAKQWGVDGYWLQRQVFDKAVRALRDKNIKVCVIISDAMRYEIGEELQARIRALDKFDAELKPAISMLPSYTQLGMASLLPNKQLKIDDGGNASVDGQSATGLKNREKILIAGRPEDRCTAIKYDELLGLSKEPARALIRDHDIVYVYHDRIDAIGDKPATEAGVFEAVEDTFEDLEKAVKKLFSANAARIIITADHGFLYQHRSLEESDYSGGSVAGAEVSHTNRRYVLGRGLTEDPALKKFAADELGLEGDLEVMIPKSINRLRKSGSGSRFVHGGASLQEVVIPVLTVTKSRESDVEPVEVQLIEGSSKTITTNQHTVRFYQLDATSEKRPGRTLKVGFYGNDDEPLSNEIDVGFDASSDDARDRETSLQLLLSKAADSYNNKPITLKLKERHGSTNHFKDYKTYQFLLRRSLGSDFDF